MKSGVNEKYGTKNKKIKTRTGTTKNLYQSFKGKEKDQRPKKCVLMQYMETRKSDKP